MADNPDLWEVDLSYGAFKAGDCMHPPEYARDVGPVYVGLGFWKHRNLCQYCGDHFDVEELLPFEAQQL